MGTAFIAGGTGFIGAEVARQLIAAGHTVRILARSDSSDRAARALGAEAVRGDLETPGPWQQEAARADWVIHLAQPDTFGSRVTQKRADAYRLRRLVMDRNLLEPLQPGTVRRILYVGGTSYYGHQGTELRDEDVRPAPRGWGPYVAPAIEALDGYLQRGLPVVPAFPGWVYGDGSWFREYTLVPLRTGKKLTALSGRSCVASPIHVKDCARALVHLLEAGQVGRRYFLVDDQPVPRRELAVLAARALNVPLRVRVVPVWLARLMLGPVLTDSIQSDCALSNARLKGLGFTLEFPSVHEGIPQVVATARP